MMMIPDLVCGELADPTSATRPHLEPWRTAKAVARAVFVVAGEISCVLLLLGVVVNLVRATP